jgi:hypothetical protein
VSPGVWRSEIGVARLWGCGAGGSGGGGDAGADHVRNAQTGYTVARVDPGRGGDLVTVVGSLLGAQPGETLRLRGRWGAHRQYGRQFQVEDYTTVLPATGQGIGRYLGSGSCGPQVTSA